MTKTARISLIRQRWQSKSRSLASLMAVANVVAIKSNTEDHDARHTARALTAERGTAMDDSIADTDKVELTRSRLAAEAAVEADENEGRSLASHLLSPIERALLAREWQRKAKPAPVVVTPDSGALPAGFVGTAFEPYVSELDSLDADTLARGRYEGQFLADVALLPLLLTA